MANNLTGDFEAVLQVSVRQVNGLLSTLHQNGISTDHSPSFPHSVIMRVGAQSKIVAKNISQYSQFLGGVQMVHGTSGAAATSDYVLASAPPGVKETVHQIIEAIGSAFAHPLHPGAVGGTAHIQLSNPTISILRGMDLMVHVFVRAHYFPDQNTPDLPAPVHGEVQIVYHITPVTLSSGKKVLRIPAPTDDGAIQFIPEGSTGMTAAGDNAITAQIRKAVRSNFQALEVALPNDFSFFQFKELGSASAAAIVLPMQLSGAAPPATLDSVTNFFLGTNDFAIAVSKEFVNSLLQTLITAFQNSAPGFTVSLAGVLDVDYTAKVFIDPLSWGTGKIDVSGSVQLHTDSKFSPDGTIGFTQSITLVLNGATQVVSLVAVGDPSVSEPWWMKHSDAMHAVRTARDGAIANASATVTQTFSNTWTQLNNVLRSFDDSASAKYTSIDVTPDGIKVHGSITTKGRLDPIIDVRETSDHQAYTALYTWIPGGRITSLTWSWVETPVFTVPGTKISFTIPWFAKTKSSVQPDRFIFPKPAAIKDNPSWASGLCLAIDGNQTTPDGFVIPVSGGWTCYASEHEPILVIPPWMAKLMAPFWLVDPGPVEGPIEDAISAHVNLLADLPAGSGLTTNSLVHFADPRAAQPLQAMSLALGQMRRQDAPLAVFMVFPSGTFQHRTEEINARLGVLQQQRGAVAELRNHEAHRVTQLVITEDYGGGWSRAFGVKHTPSTYLINARGEFVWKQEHAIEVEALTSALNQHLLPSVAPQPRLLQLTVRPGDPAHDAVFALEEGETIALRRLRGQPVLLLFWQSWSAPCLKELRRLQQLHSRKDAKSPPVIIAVNGGEERRVIDEVRHREKLTLPLVYDPEQRIAQRYGIHCWPTTVSINAMGIVDRTQFGMTHVHHAADGGEKATSA